MKIPYPPGFEKWIAQYAPDVNRDEPVVIIWSGMLAYYVGHLRWMAQRPEEDHNEAIEDMANRLAKLSHRDENSAMFCFRAEDSLASEEGDTVHMDIVKLVWGEKNHLTTHNCTCGEDKCQRCIVYDRIKRLGKFLRDMKQEIV